MEGKSDADAGAVEIGDRRELFVDDHLIERMSGGARLFLHRPVSREVVLVHDAPWEGNTCGYHTIFRDGDRYRMYYRGSDARLEGEGSRAVETHPPFACYAESTDGIHWTKPRLGLVEFNGSTHNNILLAGEAAHNFTPFKDANPECPEEARYKALGLVGRRALGAFQSADGIHWRPMGRELPVEGYFDSQNLAFWDALRGEYRMYFRDFLGDPKQGGVRGIKTATSPDFVRWSEPVWLDYPGAPVEHLYTNQIRPYHRAPHIYIGFPARFLADREGLVEGLFMSSRDGVTFRRWAEAVVRPGRNADRWHNRSNYVWWGVVETESDLPGAGTELSIYTNERYYYEGQPVRTRRFTYRLDGFVSLNAPFGGGEALTRPFRFSGDRLLLNVSTSAAGSVRVEIQDASGHPIEGYRLADCLEMYGDEIQRQVEWRSGSDVGALQGRPIRLLFALNDADVYAFRFTHERGG